MLIIILISPQITLANKRTQTVRARKKNPKIPSFLLHRKLPKVPIPRYQSVDNESSEDHKSYLLEDKANYNSVDALKPTDKTTAIKIIGINGSVKDIDREITEKTNNVYECIQ